MKYNDGYDFLNKLYNDMYKEVNYKINNNATSHDKIENYINRLENTHSNLSERKLKLLKYFYYKKYVVDELPQSYIEHEKEIAWQNGYGNIEVDEKELLKLAQNEQKSSLDKWFDYLTSPYAIYPMWFKNYVFQGMTKLGKFNKENNSFAKRTKNTVGPFIEINPEILGQMYNILYKIINKEELTDTEEQALINGESFKNLYIYFVTGTYKNNINLEETNGKWIKYEQGDDYKELWQSLQGKNTGWCTAGEETCRIQIKGGDFYVYYSNDKENNPVNPRIAIRMDDKDTIGEIRGIAECQNLESEMAPILKEKLKEFPDKDNYLKKEHDMKFLTIIENKVNNNIKLSLEELKFLYEIEENIKGFGWYDDPRIKEIKSKRNFKNDLSLIYEITPDKISSNKKELLRNNDIELFIGDLKDNKPYKLNNLKVIWGSANSKLLTSVEGLENLQSISGVACFDSLRSAEGLKKLKRIGMYAYFNSLTSAEGLENLQSIGGYADFESLTSAKGLENLQRIGNTAYFKALKSTEGLENLQIIGGDAYFNSVESVEGLESLQSIGGDAFFSDDVTYDDIKHIDIKGDIYFGGVKFLNPQGRVKK